MAQPNTSVSGHKPARIFYGWWLVLVSAIGIMLSSGSVLTFTFGVFFLPLNEEFGWSRTQISLGYSLMALAFGLLQPWIGKLIDRYTARKVILPSVVLVGVLLMSLRFLTAELWFFYVVFGVLGALGAGTGMAGYVNVISHWFDRRRGLALGLTIGGFGLGASAMPTLAHRLITELGWRGAYFALGVMVILITVPVVGLFLRETPQQMGLLPDGETVADDVDKALPIEQQGLRFGDVWRTATFWHMVVAFLLISLGIHACLIHLVPIITDSGISAETAALVASSLGITLIAARIGTGYLLDLFNAAFVSACIFVVCSVGIILLCTGNAVTQMYLAALLIGIGFGAESDIIAYMVGRYFGLRHIGELYGYFYGIYILGAVLGPVLMGVAFDTTGSYRVALLTLTAAMLFASALLVRLGFMRRDAVARSRSSPT